MLRKKVIRNPLSDIQKGPFIKTFSGEGRVNSFAYDFFL